MSLTDLNYKVTMLLEDNQSEPHIKKLKLDEDAVNLSFMAEHKKLANLKFCDENGINNFKGYKLFNFYDLNEQSSHYCYVYHNIWNILVFFVLFLILVYILAC